ncbi:hypothetical protein [Amycolatopsis sp. lyj-112]|uniref:hypothetical protein n=1 Tax=Amycolatopsis sp. lyj-112 TaxID=2789288 RepID=UPI00397D2744
MAEMLGRLRVPRAGGPAQQAEAGPAGRPPTPSFGCARNVPIEASPLALERNQFVDGDTLAFSATLIASDTAALHVMYVISSTTQRGTPREKVYFLTRTVAEPGHSLSLTKSHALRSTAT